MRAEAAVQLGCFFGKVLKNHNYEARGGADIREPGPTGFVLTFLPGPATLVRETPTRSAFTVTATDWH